MAPRTVVLLPPSEAKAPGGHGPPWQPGTSAVPVLDSARAEVLGALHPNEGISTGPTMAAIERYTGVLYRELDASSLGPPARRRLVRNVLIISGLWGVVAPRDPIPYYRLKMSARLDGLGRLSSWWRPQLTEALQPRLQGAVVWDLLPAEHAAAIDWSRLDPRRRITIRFLDSSSRTVSHWNKLLKGSLVRWLAETGSTSPAALVDMQHPQGYRLDPSASVLNGATPQLVLRPSASQAEPIPRGALSRRFGPDPVGSP